MNIDGMPVFNAHTLDKGVLCKGSVVGPTVLYPNGKWEKYNCRTHQCDIEDHKIYNCVMGNAYTRPLTGSEVNKHSNVILGITGEIEKTKILARQGVYWVSLYNGSRCVICDLKWCGESGVFLYDEYGNCLSTPNGVTNYDVAEILPWEFGVVHKGVVRHESGFYKLSDKIG